MRTRRIPAAFAAFTLTALAGLALSTQPAAHAQSVMFTDAASFDAATSGLTTPFTFDGFTTPGGYTQYGTTLTADGITFTSPIGGTSEGLFVDDPGDGNGDPFGGHEYLDSVGPNNGSGGIINFAPPAGYTAFSADFASYYDVADTLTLIVNGQSFTLSVPATDSNSSVFAGFVSSTPITSLSFSGSQGAAVGLNGPAIDNLQFGNPAAITATPEPASYAAFALGGFGLLGLGLKTRMLKARKRTS